MVTGKLGGFGKGVESVGNPTKTCSEQGGGAPIEGDCSGGKIQIVSSDSIAIGKKCCKGLGSSPVQPPEVSTLCCSQCVASELSCYTFCDSSC